MSSTSPTASSAKPSDPDPAAPILSEGTVLAGRFLIEQLAGSGGMGEVYKAFDILLERFVALKFLLDKGQETPTHLRRFRQEALALAHLNHPHVCQLYDFVSTEKGSFLAIEWVEGQTLDQSDPDMPMEEKLGLLLQVSEGLAAAHAKGMIHRDLKPLNLMVNKEGQIKILDFGLARFASMDEGSPVSSADHLIPQGTDASFALPINAAELPTGCFPAISESRPNPLTHVGFFMGSPRYASPEQVRGELAGMPSDVFSFGIIMWELLLSEHPYAGEGKDLLKAILEGKRKPLGSRLPRNLSRLLEAMLASNPKDRPSANQIVHALRGQIPASGMRTRWGAVSLAAGVLVPALAVASYFGFRAAAPKPPPTPTPTPGDGAVESPKQASLPLWNFENGTLEGWHGSGPWANACSITQDARYVTEGRAALKLDCSGSMDWNQNLAINDGPFPRDIHHLIQVTVDVNAPQDSVSGMDYCEIYLVFMCRPNGWYEIKRQFRPGRQTITFDVDPSRIQQEIWHVYLVLNSSQPFKGPIYVDRVTGKVALADAKANS
ncbi:MAG TPA: serine/threonine-protein kinase [Holophaga sp.]|nr:serine/threonine-protein kinase [Holophaga sp.]